MFARGVTPKKPRNALTFPSRSTHSSPFPSMESESSYDFPMRERAPSEQEIERITKIKEEEQKLEAEKQALLKERERLEEERKRVERERIEVE